MPNTIMTDISRSAHPDRLDTPSSVGFRSGMSCTAVIARKLGALYDVDDAMPTALERALSTLDRRIKR